MRWAIRPSSRTIRPSRLAASRHSSNLYERLSLSLGVKSEQDERLQGFLARDPTDAKNARRLQQQVQSMAKSMPNREDLIKKFTIEHKGFSGPIFNAIIAEMMHQRSSQLHSAYQELASRLGHPPTETVYTMLTTGVFDNSQVYMPVLLELFAEIPDYLLTDFSNVWVPRWLELKAPPTNMDMIVKAAGRRGLFPFNRSGYKALSLHLQKPVQILEYTKIVTGYLSNLGSHQRVPQLRQGFAVTIARKLRILPPQMHPDNVLSAFVKEVQRLRPSVGRSPVLGSRFWQVANRSLPDMAEEGLPITIEQCYEDINELTSNWKSGNRLDKTPRRMAQLYGRILSRYALYEASSLDAVYNQADATCNQLFGAETASNRRRRWLTAILSTFVHAGQYQKALKYVPQVQQTHTSYLWGLAVITLAKTNHFEQAWEWTERALTEKHSELPSRVGVILLQSCMHSTNTTDFAARLAQLHKWNMVLTDQQLAQVLGFAGTGGCRYRWPDLRKLLFSFADELVQRSEILRIDAGLGQLRKPHAVLGVPALKEIVRWGFVKNPLEPWCTIELLKEVRTRNVYIDSASVQEAVSQVLAELQNSQGEAVRVRQQCPHNSSVISEQFAKMIEGLY